MCLQHVLPHEQCLALGTVSAARVSLRHVSLQHVELIRYHVADRHSEALCVSHGSQHVSLRRVSPRAVSFLALTLRHVPQHMSLQRAERPFSRISQHGPCGARVCVRSSPVSLWRTSSCGLDSCSPGEWSGLRGRMRATACA